MIHQNDPESPQPVAEAESLVGVALTDLFASLVRRHNLTVNDLTEAQLAEAIRQAMPDFRRYVHANKQAIVYLPGQEADRWKAKCAELEAVINTYRGLCDRGYNIAIGNADPSDVDDYITDYNEVISSANANIHP